MPDSDTWRELAREFRNLDPDGKIQVHIQPGKYRWTVIGKGVLPFSVMMQFSTLAKRAGAMIDHGSPLALDDIWFQALESRFPATDALNHATERSAELCSVMEYHALERERVENINSVDSIVAGERPTNRREIVEPILKAKGWSVYDWANKAKVSHATAMDYIKGTKTPYASTRKKLADALGVDIRDLPE
jgi:lambda repressor-like predicted transcriptional regulator